MGTNIPFSSNSGQPQMGFGMPAGGNMPMNRPGQPNRFMQTRPGMSLPVTGLRPPVARPGPVPLPGPAPRPIIGPPPAPMPPMPYGGPISMPGGGPAPLPTNGMGNGKGGPGPVGGMPQGPWISGANNLRDPQTGQLFAGQPIGLPTAGMGGGKSMPGGNLGGPPGGPVDINGNMQMPGQQLPPGINFNFNPNTGGPLGPQSQPQPNFSNALGTASPLLNTIQR